MSGADGAFIGRLGEPGGGEGEDEGEENRSKRIALLRSF